MAVRKVTLIIVAVLLATLAWSPVQACFGPKLFVAAEQGTRQEALYALVTLYIQEKTGVESTRVEVESGQDPFALLSAEKIDLVIVASDEPVDNAVMQIDGMPLVVTGKRPLEDLQFTTVLPAIKKLNRLLKAGDVELLVRQIEAGESALSVARKFLMELRWI